MLRKNVLFNNLDTYTYVGPFQPINSLVGGLFNNNGRKVGVRTREYGRNTK